MPLLLVLPLAIALLLLAGLLLMPLSLLLRYRRGKGRRRVQPWGVRVNAWLLLASALVLLAVAASLGSWWPGALRDAAAGLVAGVLAGALGLQLDRFEATPRGFFRTPNRWLVLALSWLLAARIVAGLWLAWGGPEAGSGWVTRSGLLGVGGVLLGFALATAWGLRHRVLRARRP